MVYVELETENTKLPDEQLASQALPKKPIDPGQTDA